ncbi:uncharacterized protein LOC133805719 [Humulus lupulus]|uniref:uncharacterized protein LOC133805719 n=1 Tax=Humulus lupulus TaxID=3486 RepID=UPI002B413567|nr:uncharacterized protein LOC133805719 [Humulus lupulus]
MEAAKVGSLTREELKMAITVRVRLGSKLWDNMLKNEVTGLDDFYERAQKYISVDDGHKSLNAGKSEPSLKPSTHEGLNSAKRKKAYKELRDNHLRKPKHVDEHRQTQHTFYTDLTHTREHIFVTNKNQVPFGRPLPIKRDRSKRDPGKYCQYHKDIGHTTAECNHLKVEIEELIRRGHLGRYVTKENPRPEGRSASPRAHERAPEVQGEVRKVFGDPTFKGESGRGRSTYAKEFFAYSNPLVLTVHIANTKVHHVLMDNGSLVDILYQLALEKMGLGIKNCRPCHTSLYGFTGSSIQPLGTIGLALIVGEQPKQTTVISNFIVVDCASTFNAVLGRPSQRIESGDLNLPPVCYIPNSWRNSKHKGK